MYNVCHITMKKCRRKCFEKPKIVLYNICSVQGARISIIIKQILILQFLGQFYNTNLNANPTWNVVIFWFLLEFLFLENVFYPLRPAGYSPKYHIRILFLLHTFFNYFFFNIKRVKKVKRAPGVFFRRKILIIFSTHMVAW